MIKDFACKETEKIFKSQLSKKFPIHVQKQSYVILHSMHIAKNLKQIRDIDPSHFKKLHKDFHEFQLRVNNQYRIHFSIIDDEITELQLIDVQMKDFH